MDAIRPFRAALATYEYELGDEAGKQAAMEVMALYKPGEIIENSMGLGLPAHWRIVELHTEEVQQGGHVRGVLIAECTPVT